MKIKRQFYKEIKGRTYSKNDVETSTVYGNIGSIAFKTRSISVRVKHHSLNVNHWLTFKLTTLQWAWHGTGIINWSSEGHDPHLTSMTPNGSIFFCKLLLNGASNDTKIGCIQFLWAEANKYKFSFLLGASTVRAI